MLLPLACPDLIQIWIEEHLTSNTVKEAIRVKQYIVDFQEQLFEISGNSKTTKIKYPGENQTKDFPIYWNIESPDLIQALRLTTLKIDEIYFGALG